MSNQKCELFISGMHCASCEVLIEKKLLKKHPNIDSVDASLSDHKVVIYYNGSEPNLNSINEEFQNEGYLFSRYEIDIKKDVPIFSFSENGSLLINSAKFSKALLVGFIVLILLLSFYVLDKIAIANGLMETGINDLMKPGSKLNLSAFTIIFITGLIAGLSSCAALIGGLLLSLSKQWNEIYVTKNATTFQKTLPFLMFNLGRIIVFPILGGILGLIGNFFQLTVEFNALLIIVIGFLMIALGGQMLGIKVCQNFVIRLPKSIGRYIADESNFQGKWLPFTVGGLTFFLPCGFTIIAQAIALVSGSFISGALVMLFFALGTLPMLAVISVISIKANKNIGFGDYFNYIAGVLVILFGVYNINNQFALLGTPNISYITNFYGLIEFMVFLILLLTLGKLAIDIFKIIKNSRDSYKKILLSVILIFYMVVIVSILTSYNLLMPWEYKFTPLS